MGYSTQDYWSGVPLPSLVYDTIHRYTLISHVLYWLFKVYRHDVRAFKMARVVKNSPANKRNIKTCYARDVTKFCQENTLVIANTLFQQHKRRLYIWASPDGQYRNQIDYILCSQRWRSSIQLVKTRPWADCGSDHELLIAKFRLKLKKVGKTTRPFKFDLNGILYDYTVEVTNRFEGLDLIDRVSEELRTEVRDIVEEAWIKAISQEEEMQKGKKFDLRRPYKQLWKEEKRKGKEKRKDIPIWMQSSKE